MTPSPSGDVHGHQDTKLPIEEWPHHVLQYNSEPEPSGFEQPKKARGVFNINSFYLIPCLTAAALSVWILSVSTSFTYEVDMHVEW